MGTCALCNTEVEDDQTDAHMKANHADAAAPAAEAPAEEAAAPAAEAPAEEAAPAPEAPAAE